MNLSLFALQKEEDVAMRLKNKSRCPRPELWQVLLGSEGEDKLHKEGWAKVTRRRKV